MLRHTTIAVLAVAAFSGAIGCRHRCCKSDITARPFLPVPPGGPATIPPADVPTTPFPPPAARSGSGIPDPLLSPSNFGPPAAGNKPSQELLLPDPLPSGSSRSLSPPPPSNLLGDPISPQQSTEPPLAPKPAPAAPGTVFPPPADPSAPAAKAPAQASRFPGLQGLVVVKESVASGRKPTNEGLDLLKKSGYRTVVYLHGEGADVAALKDDAEKRGLSFLAIETTPTRLASASDAFNDAVANPANRPAYVCDDDGLRAGVLWCVHFRTVEILNADAAAIRARPLGYATESEEAKTFQVAIQQFFSTK